MHDEIVCYLDELFNLPPPPPPPSESIISIAQNAFTGPLASTGVDGLAFVSTKYAAKEHKNLDWPDIEMHMIPADVVADGGRYLKHLAGLNDRLWHAYYKYYMHTPSFSIDPVLLRPKSRGWLRLRSRNPYDHPLIDPNYLSHPHDVATTIEGMKLAIEIGLSAPFRRHFNARLFDLPVPGCEHYAFLTDAYLECVARTLTWTIYHPVGTCKMVADERDPSGVVDSQLRVMGGIKGLRVVDASIMPKIVSGEYCDCIIIIGLRSDTLLVWPFSLTDFRQISLSNQSPSSSLSFACLPLLLLLLLLPPTKQFPTEPTAANTNAPAIMIAERAADLIRFGGGSGGGGSSAWSTGQQALLMDGSQWPPAVEMIEEQEGDRVGHRFNLTRGTPNYYQQLERALKKYNTKGQPDQLLEHKNWTYSEPPAVARGSRGVELPS